ncbi:hypothetical protein K2Y11_18365 [bacterium]|nr:hypothetical protein [bacterium]
MFRLESDMAASVTRWMKRAGLHIKAEFVTPWGICDLAGLSFNSEHVSHRLSLRQKKSVTSITRATLLLEVPDVEERKSISIDRLAGKFASSLGKELVATEIERLIADGFLVRTSRGRLQKLNGWMPLQSRLVAVELKLNRVQEAMAQAKANLGFVEESYVAIPMPLAKRIALDPRPWSAYFDDGIGLIGVLRQRCEVLIPQSPSSSSRYDPAVRLYCVEKFWRTHRSV